MLNNIWVFIAGILVFHAGRLCAPRSGPYPSEKCGQRCEDMADAIVGILAFLQLDTPSPLVQAVASGLKWKLSSADTTTTPLSMRRARPRHFLPGGVCRNGRHHRIWRHGGTHKVFRLPGVQPRDVCLRIPSCRHWTWGGGLIAQMSIGDAVCSDFAGSASFTWSAVSLPYGSDVPRTSNWQILPTEL